MMMAVRSPLPTPATANAFISAFSPFSDTPDSPRPVHAAGRLTAMTQPSEKAARLVPPSPSNNNSNESVDPSPIAPSSNGTEFTDVDEVVDNNDKDPPKPQRAIQVKSPVRPLSKLQTSTRQDTPYPVPSDDEDEPPQSVIHAPPGFGGFFVNMPPSTDTISKRTSAPPRAESSQRPEVADSKRSSQVGSQISQRPSSSDVRTESTESVGSRATDITAVKTPAVVEHNVPQKKSSMESPISPAPLTTDLNSTKDWSDRATPRAQTRQEVEEFDKRQRASSLSNLADIPEGQDADPPNAEKTEANAEEEAINKAVGHFRDTEEEIKALRTALAECWTLCNTLASLSHVHRERIFNFAGKGDMQEQAWKTCWTLCQNLYDSRDDGTPAHVRPTLDLCRDFCQALFEVRVRDNEAADSVLRVSFELNNHLYNTHDRNLPEAFRERTLDFYITLCHRLMKQNSRLAEETDSLLRACWSLAEMLFSLRQNKREGTKPDEELLGSAVQACWELCDLFREGWTQIRPDRGTPRPSQTTFTQAFQQVKRSGFVPTDDPPPPSGLISLPRPGFPETPTTVFEDTVNVSPDEAPVPNILVFGHATPKVQQRAGGASHSGHTPISQNPTSASLNAHKWSSASSTLSSSSRASNRSAHSALSATSSTHTVTTPSEDPNLTLLKVLFVKAALNTGFDRNRSTHPHQSGFTTHSSPPQLPYTFPAFVKSLPDNAFGIQPWQMALLDNYKKVVADDSAFRNIGPPVRAAAVDVARAVRAMVQSGYFTWLRDLYRLVFGFYIEESPNKKNVAVQT